MEQIKNIFLALNNTAFGRIAKMTDGRICVLISEKEFDCTVFYDVWLSWSIASIIPKKLLDKASPFAVFICRYFFCAHVLALQKLFSSILTTLFDYHMPNEEQLDAG